MRLWTRLFAGVDEPEAFESFLLNFEGWYREVTYYIDNRLQAELPQRWRWQAPFIDHAAVGDRGISMGMLVVFDDKSTHGDEPGGFSTCAQVSPTPARRSRWGQ